MQEDECRFILLFYLWRDKKQAPQPHPETAGPARLNLSLNFIYPSFAPRHNSCKHSSALGLSSGKKLFHLCKQHQKQKVQKVRIFFKKILIPTKFYPNNGIGYSPLSPICRLHSWNYKNKTYSNIVFQAYFHIPICFSIFAKAKGHEYELRRIIQKLPTPDNASESWIQERVIQ